MPASIRVAVIALLGLLGIPALFADSFGSLLAHFGFWLLILLGFVKRHRLVWQWGRFLPLIIAIRLAHPLINGEMPSAEAWFEFVIDEALVVVIAIAITRRDSAVYFRLFCPMCQSESKKADDFFFNRAKCLKCQNVW